MITLAPAGVRDAAAIEHLLDTCFGPARRARTAYRLRDGVEPIGPLSLVARDGAELAGSIQLWPLHLEHGAVTSLTLLGPLAVSPERRCEGVGKALLTEALARVDDGGYPPVLLIGDAPYYGQFGFEAAPTQLWTVPGHVDRARLLVRRGGHLPVHGRLAAAGEPVRRAA